MDLYILVSINKNVFFVLTFRSHTHNSSPLRNHATYSIIFSVDVFEHLSLFDSLQTHSYRRILVQAPQKVRRCSRLRSASLSHEYHGSLYPDHELQQPCCPDSVDSRNQNLWELFLGIVNVLRDDVDPGDPEELLGVKIILE